MCPICVGMASILSLIYSQIKYGYVNMEALYGPFKISYVNWYVFLILNRHIYGSCFRLPWDQFTTIGWIFEQIYCDITLVPYLLVILLFLTFFVSICEYHRAFYELFQSQIDEVNFEVLGNSYQTYYYVKKSLRKSIFFHISVKK